MRTIDGVEIPTAEQATISFFRDEVRVTMNCGSVTNVLFLDTDGSGLHFMASDTVRDACGGATSPVEHDQLEVLHEVESWWIVDDDHIVLEGGRAVLLERAPAE